MFDELLPDVAGKLKEMGIKGRCRDGELCPIAIYLHRKCGNERVVVGLTHAFVGYQDIMYPDEVAVFIKAFDDGMYPELIERG